MTYSVTIEDPDELLAHAGIPPDHFDEEARFILSAKFYEMGRLTAGQAAKLCGMGRVDFLHSLQRLGVSLSNMGPEDAGHEVKFIDDAK